MPNETTVGDRDPHDTPTENFSIVLRLTMVTRRNTQAAIPVIGIRGARHIVGTTSTRGASRLAAPRTCSRPGAAQQPQQMVAALLEHLDTGRSGRRSRHGTAQQGVNLGVRCPLSRGEHTDETVDLAA